MANVCVCSISFLSYSWYLVVDLMTCVTCDVTHTGSLFILADTFLTLVWSMLSLCLSAYLILGLVLGIPLVFSLASWGKT